MFKTVLTLFRGSVAAAGEEQEDRSALLILDQQIRDAGAAVERSKRTLALAIAGDQQEGRRLDATNARIADLETRATAALDGGREDLAREAAQAIANLALHARDFRREQGSRRHRGVAVGFEIGNRLCRLAGEIFPTTIKCRGGADFEIGDPGIGDVETAAFLLVAGDRQRQGALGALDGRGRIAHLLVENEKRRAVFQFFSRGSHAAPKERQNSFEHWWLPVL